MGSLLARMFYPMGRDVEWSDPDPDLHADWRKDLESLGVTGGLLHGVARIGDIKCCELGMAPVLCDNLILIHAGNLILL